jgi:AcrR family transcriptional regulator
VTTSGPATSRAKQAERTRQLILDTAAGLFAGEGYDAVSLQMIADAVGISKANVYYYFHTKTEIVAAITAPTLSAMNALFDAAAAIRGHRQRVKFLVDGYVDALLANRGMATVSANDPAFRRERDLSLGNQRVRDRGLQILFGDQSTPEQQVAYQLLADLRQTLPFIADLSEDHARHILTQACQRILQIATAAPRHPVDAARS